MDAALSAPRHAAPIVFEDGLGERLPAVGGANESLEVLKVSNELSAVSTFETALREQSLRLTEFRHDAFARVRAVERLDPRTSTVVVISDRVRGVRLSEVLATAERQGIALELNAALCLIRQLVAAVAAFHEAAPDSCHGAIAPDRIVITQEGRLVVVEYVLGPALEELRFSQERYWRELGIALPHTFGLPRFDLFADVTQVGAVALALVLGRRLHVRRVPREDRRGRRQRLHPVGIGGIGADPRAVADLAAQRAAARTTALVRLGDWREEGPGGRVESREPRGRTRVVARVPDQVHVGRAGRPHAGSRGRHDRRASGTAGTCAAVPGCDSDPRVRCSAGRPSRASACSTQGRPFAVAWPRDRPGPSLRRRRRP